MVQHTKKSRSADMYTIYILSCCIANEDAGWHEVLQVQHWTTDQVVTGSTPARAMLCNNFREVAHALCLVTKQYNLAPV